MIDTARFKFIANALHGTGGFRPLVVPSYIDTAPTFTGETYLVPHPREGKEKFARRNEIAWYVNDLNATCARFAGYLSSKRPSRVLNNPLLQAFADDCDWRGNAIDVFWSQFTVEAKARGSMLLLVDMPRGEDLPANQGEQIERRAFPYLAMIAPESVTAIEMNERGQVASIEIIDGKQRRGWNETRWWVVEGGNETDSGDHNLGICPVLAFAETLFPNEGEFAQLADLSKRMYNLRSELDEILRAQTFSILTLQVPPEQDHNFDPSKLAAMIGTHNLMKHSGETPAFIAPPDGPARIYLDVIAQIEEKMRRIGHMIEAPNQAESGIALQIRFQQLNSALSHWAARMEDLERRVWFLVARWLGIEDRTTIAWSDDYAVTDLKTELDILAAMLSSGFSNETLRAKRQQVVNLVFSELPADDVEILIEAEALGDYEIRSSETVADTAGTESGSEDHQESSNGGV